MQRIMVDLPEPDGPQMTIRSLLVTRRLMSRSTWKSPYHLCTPIMSTATPVRSGAGLSASCSGIKVPSPPVARRKTVLDETCVARHAEAEDQVEDRGKDKAARRGHRRCPERVDPRRLDGHQEIEDADDENKRRVLEQPNGGVDDIWDGDFQRLRQDHEPHGLPVT